MLPRMKLADHMQLRAFISEHTTATLAVSIDDNGTIHAASLLYVHSENPFRLYFVTAKTTEKYRLLHTKPSIPAAVVIGTEKGTPFTVQLRGLLQTVDPAHNTNIIEKYYEKRGNRGDDIADSKNSLLMFIPRWGRYTDYAKGYEQSLLEL